MRVWLVTDHFPPQRNGHAVAVAWWARALAHGGASVTVIAHAWPGEDPAAQQQDWRHREVRLPVWPLLPGGHPLAGFRPDGGRIAALATDPPDVVHLHGYGAACARVAATLPGVACVLSVHALPGGAGALAWGPVHSAMRRRFARVLQGCDVVTAPSVAAAERVRAIAGRDDVRVVPTGLDDAFRAIARGGPAAAAPDRPHVLYVGRLSPDKGFGTVTALAAVHPEAHWSAIGDGRARSNGVTTMPHRPVAEVARAIRDADVLIAPSVHETQGLAAHEAIAVGTPVVAPTRTAQADIVREGVSGALYERGDLEGAWRAVLRAARVSRDDVLRTADRGSDAARLAAMLAIYAEAMAVAADREAR
ncbi:glycosyltransferase family 1 protein [soil metagenome]